MIDGLIADNFAAAGGGGVGGVATELAARLAPIYSAPQAAIESWGAAAG